MKENPKSMFLNMKVVFLHLFFIVTKIKRSFIIPQFQLKGIVTMCTWISHCNIQQATRKTYFHMLIISVPAKVVFMKVGLKVH